MGVKMNALARRRIYKGRRAVVSLYILISLFFALTALAAEMREEAPVNQALPLNAVSDETLQRRLESVLGQIKDFKNITPQVHEGVVVLGGTVESAAARERVEKLVSRFQGVLYVDNRVEQKLELETRVTPALEKLEQIWNKGTEYLPLVGVALLIIFLFWFVSFVLTRWEVLHRRLGGETLLGNLIRQLVRMILLLMGLLLALEILDLTTLIGALVGTAGLFGLAMGFAFRDIVENYLAGVLLSIRSPFRLNEFVSLAGEEGVIVQLTTREVVLMTLDGNHIRIPNAVVFRSVIQNFTRNPFRRFQFLVGIGMAEDLVYVQEIGLRTLRAMKGVVDDPSPSMRVEEIGDHSMSVLFMGWVDQREADYLKVRSEAIRLVKKGLDQAGVELPEPSQTIHLLKAGEAAARRPEPSISVEEDAMQADVAVVRQLDKQIEEDLRAEENLLRKS
jgi:small-conductance mechanosensitive channel